MTNPYRDGDDQEKRRAEARALARELFVAGYPNRCDPEDAYYKARKFLEYDPDAGPRASAPPPPPAPPRPPTPPTARTTPPPPPRPWFMFVPLGIGATTGLSFALEMKASGGHFTPLATASVVFFFITLGLLFARADRVA